MVLEYDWTAALYDSASTITEHFTFPGWFGPGAAWKGSYTPGDLTAALFNSGVDDVEHFASANWPDEGYPL